MSRAKFLNQEDLTAAKLKGPDALREILSLANQETQDIHNEIMSVVEPYLPGTFGIVIGFFWDCPDSPFGLCAYDHYDDPAHDDCIFCHEPSERK